MKILLIEPNYRTALLPLGLQKIAAYHIHQGDVVFFTKGVPNKKITDNFYPDIIYITSLFVYYGDIVLKTIKKCQKRYPKSKIKIGGVFATLMPELIKNETGITPHKGLFKKVENFLPDFSIFPKSEKTMVFTTRGCIRKCNFCAVKTLEPKFEIVKNWKRQITNDIENKKTLLIQDNNFTATPKKHQTNVINFLEDKKIVVDFNSGFDARIYKDWHAKLYKKIKLQIIRFAFDTMEEDGHIQRSIELAWKNKNFANVPTIYILYNFNDTPEDLYYRLRECAKSIANGYPMRYAPLNDINGSNYVGKNWTREQLINFYKILRAGSHGQMMSFCCLNKDLSLKRFESIYGRNKNEFVDLITVGKKKYKIKIQTKKLKRKGFIL